MSFDDSASNGQTQPCPLRFGGVERLEQVDALFRVKTRPVVQNLHEEARAAFDLRRLTANDDLNRIGAGSQGIVEQVPKDLTQPESIHETERLGGDDGFDQTSLPLPVLGFEIGPGPSPDFGKAGDLTVQPDGCGIATNILEEVVQVVLGTLDP